MSNKKYLNTYRIESSRLPGHDYSANAKYFVTIKTFMNEKYFGDIVKTPHGASPQLGKIPNNELYNTQDQLSGPYAETPRGASLLLSPIGIIAKQNWMAIPDHFPFVKLDEFEIMPDHVHGILFFETLSKTTYESNKPGVKSGSLGTVLNLYKGSVTKYANLNGLEFRWHSRFHDTIIRHDMDLDNFRNYIRNNPDNWDK